MKRMRQICIGAVYALLLGTVVSGAEYFVSPTGSDSAVGSFDYPFKTIGKAVQMVSAGGFIYLRAGQHNYTSTISLSKSGTDGNVITIQAWQDEDVVLDFTAQATGGRGIDVGGSYWHLNNFIVQNAGDNGVYVDGSHNTIERIVSRWNEDSGIQLDTGAAYNLVLNCDSYENYDVNNIDPGRGENADGFAAKFGLGPGNILRGCRSWSNSDDGFDCWNKTVDQVHGAAMDHCIAYRNGIDIWGGTTPFQGDGNGFKLGQGYGAHFLTRCIAYDHPHHGIDVNGNLTGVTVYNSTCEGNLGNNFYFDEHSSIHVLRNNLSYNGSVNIYPEIDDTYNSWNGFTVSNSDFVSLDSAGLEGPRQADGSLPGASFLRLITGSGLIDGGIDVGLAYKGAAPDLGAYEWLAGDCCQSDGRVDLADLQCFAGVWLSLGCGPCSGADFDGSGTVNIADFGMLASNWSD